MQRRITNPGIFLRIAPKRVLQLDDLAEDFHLFDVENIALTSGICTI
jgi:hypothetical protein